MQKGWGRQYFGRCTENLKPICNRAGVLKFHVLSTSENLKLTRNNRLQTTTKKAWTGVLTTSQGRRLGDDVTFVESPMFLEKINPLTLRGCNFTVLTLF